MTVRSPGGNTGDDGSPHLYEDGNDYLVQGYTESDPSVLAQLKVIPPGETVVRVPKNLMIYLPKDAGGVCDA
jgi:hypothetical protein